MKDQDEILSDRSDLESLESLAEEEDNEPPPLEPQIIVEKHKEAEPAEDVKEIPTVVEAEAPPTDYEDPNVVNLLKEAAPASPTIDYPPFEQPVEGVS